MNWKNFIRTGLGVSLFIVGAAVFGESGGKLTPVLIGAILAGLGFALLFSD